MARPALYNIAPGTSELDLRDWFDRIVYGDSEHPAHGHYCIVRYMRRDDTGTPINCACRDPLTREAAAECAYCDGEGYLWDEVWATTYSTYVGADGGLAGRFVNLQPGRLKTDYKVFFFRYDSVIQDDDKIIEVELDQEGLVRVPVRRTSIYRPETINEQRADNGRIEFIAIYAREHSSIRSNYVR